jgi:hypothetical protein
LKHLRGDAEVVEPAERVPYHLATILSVGVSHTYMRNSPAAENLVDERKTALSG